jgi:hypothetical protein
MPKRSSSGSTREAEQRAVELAPVVAAVGADVLHDAEPVQAGQRGARVDVGIGLKSTS